MKWPYCPHILFENLQITFENQMDAQKPLIMVKTYVKLETNAAFLMNRFICTLLFHTQKNCQFEIMNSGVILCIKYWYASCIAPSHHRFMNIFRFENDIALLIQIILKVLNRVLARGAINLTSNISCFNNK